MGTIATIALALLGICFMIFVTFFGRLPALRHTPIAWLYKLIWVLIPNGAASLDQRISGGKIFTSCSRLGNYLMYDRHPTILIFFLVLLIGGEALYLPAAWPQFSPLVKTTGAVAILLPYVFLYLSAFSDPGYITPSNHITEMARYPYDFTLFHPGAACSTCDFLKPARSKHCRVCKRCIARQDHHCIFINNCVGAGNHHWFVLLLLSTAVLTLYGGVLGVGLMTAKMRLRFPGWSYYPWLSRDNGGGGMSFTQWLIVWSWGMQAGGGVAFGAVTLLALMTTPLVWGLLGYHLWLIYCGTTTNESMKWSDWQMDMDDGYAFKRRLDSGRVKDVRVEPAWTRWPAEAEQVLVRTENGRPPEPGTDLPGVGEWEAVWRLREVENLYDLGLWDNLLDVFIPGFMFRDPHVPVPEARLRRKKKRRARKIYLA
ncbi:DHHC palmitoyltransferase-domain-containing protein [Achaetomium macrosporum]|uniref:Palmitoyltransferase n=1 Tax=Achaetomium macrosporum TaxID=79813 RepID=A0AAN7C9Q2_9PEZI|nr:DHHC palmitoyltransferase-domain-containing protein [Achaetomium macrosporum]